jgi:hypothetical protein
MYILIVEVILLLVFVSMVLQGYIKGLNFIAPGPYHFIKLISERIRIGTPSEYQNTQLSWPHGITSVTGPRRYIKNVSLLLLDHVIAWLARLPNSILTSQKSLNMDEHVS